MSVRLPQEGFQGVVLAGRYRIEQRLGAGGMGEVYRAVNTAIDRPVAVKMLRPELMNNADLVERFLREAKAATIVRHPNVVDVLDVIEHDGVPMIVQELLHGKDLAKYIEVSGGKLAVDDVLPLLIPAIEAVGVAHSKGVIHRDLKPENVFLHEVEGQIVPKVLDFGISKVNTPDTRRMTSTGTAMGTPAYMSPEQIQGTASVDPRGDVWSLGVVLFESLSGRLPFEAETQGGLFVQICTTRARSLDTVVSDVPASVVAIVARCLEPNRDARFANGTELARALRAVMAERGVESTNKLRAIGPAIIEALEAQGALPGPDAPSTARTIAARRPPENATVKAVPSALAQESRASEHRESGHRESERQERERGGRGSVLIASVSAAVVAVVAVAVISVQSMGANAARTTNGTSVDGAVSNVATVRDEDSGVVAAQHSAEDAAVMAIADAAVTAAEDAPSVVASNRDEAPADERDERRHRRARAGRDAGARSGATTAANATNGTANGTTTAPSTQNSQSTIVTTSGRHTHAATTYEP